jgi:hypothetical protein
MYPMVGYRSTSSTLSEITFGIRVRIEFKAGQLKLNAIGSCSQDTGIPNESKKINCSSETSGFHIITLMLIQALNLI